MWVLKINSSTFFKQQQKSFLLFQSHTSKDKPWLMFIWNAHHAINKKWEDILTQSFLAQTASDTFVFSCSWLVSVRRVSSSWLVSELLSLRALSSCPSNSATRWERPDTWQTNTVHHFSGHFTAASLRIQVKCPANTNIFFRVSLQNITDINSKYKKYTIATAKANSNDSISYFLLLNVSLKEYFFKFVC